jgi:hypothetical protein
MRRMECRDGCGQVQVREDGSPELAFAGGVAKLATMADLPPYGGRIIVCVLAAGELRFTASQVG